MPRAKKSDATKAASGTLQPCRQRQVNASEFKLTIEPPIGLTKDAREAWSLAVQCAPDGVLTALDFTVLERWARNYALYRKIAKKLDSEDVVIEDFEGGLPTLNPRFNALVKIQQVISACEKELGFTPVSRARVPAKAKEQDVNEFGDF